MQTDKTVSPSERGMKGEKKTGRSKSKFSKESIRKRGLITNGRSLPYNPNNRPKAKILRRNMTLHEKLVWQRIRKQDFRVLRQHPIDHYIVDFYIASAGLVIEIDGDSHLTHDAQVYDQQITDLLELYGLEVIRFTNDYVIEWFDEMCKKILEEVYQRS